LASHFDNSDVLNKTKIEQMFLRLFLKCVIIISVDDTEISKFINAYKSASSRIIKKEFPHIRKSLWKEMFWSQSYCLITTGGATVDAIKQYIQSQGAKDHGK